MKLVVSLVLLGLVLLLPLYVLASVLRRLLGVVDAMFAKSLVSEKDAVRPAPGSRKWRNVLLSWLLTLGVFVFVVANVPQAPELERDRSLEIIERMYATGLSALRIEYADSLLNDFTYDDQLVRQICRGVDPVVYGSHEYRLECAMLQNALVGVQVMDKDREVFSGTWVVP